MRVLFMNKMDRKKYIKNIEKHLRNYNNYNIAIANLEKQLSFISSIKTQFPSSSDYSSDKFPSVHLIENKLNELKVLRDSIENALKELSDLEEKFVEYRYFKKWTINKCALELGYSDKALFIIRNQVMDKLIISLGSIIYLEY